MESDFPALCCTLAGLPIGLLGRQAASHEARARSPRGSSACTCARAFCSAARPASRQVSTQGGGRSSPCSHGHGRRQRRRARRRPAQRPPSRHPSAALHQQYWLPTSINRAKLDPRPLHGRFAGCPVTAFFSQHPPAAAERHDAGATEGTRLAALQHPAAPLPLLQCPEPAAGVAAGQFNVVLG